jgi:hypothetical protein
MTNSEAIETYEELSAILREFGLGWIVDQVEEDIRAGKAEQKRKAIQSSMEEHEDWKLEPPSDARVYRRKSTREEEFTALTDFNPRERLELLIDATDRAVAGAANLEFQVLKMEPFSPMKLVLAVEETNASRVLDLEHADRRLTAVHRLTKALASLRSELRNGN